MMTVTQIPVQCPHDGYYMFKVTREVYNVDKKQTEDKQDSFICMKCSPDVYMMALMKATRITMLKESDIRGDH